MNRPRQLFLVTVAALLSVMGAVGQVRPSGSEAERLAKQGSNLYRDGQYDAAVEAFRKAIAINPAEGLWYFGMGMALADEGKLQDAAQAYEQSAALLQKQKASRVNVCSALNNLALVYYRQGRLDDADARIDQAVQIYPANADPWVSRGLVLEARGKLDEAIGAYRKGLSLSYRSLEAAQNLGLALQ